MKRFDLDNDQKIDTGFKIPDNYFEQFEAKIMNQLPEREVKVVSIFSTKKFWITSVAAVFVLGIFTTMYLSYSKTEEAITEDYLAYETSITTEDIIEHLTDEDITAIEQSMDLYDEETKTYAADYLY